MYYFSRSKDGISQNFIVLNYIQRLLVTNIMDQLLQSDKNSSTNTKVLQNIESQNFVPI